LEDLWCIVLKDKFQIQLLNAEPVRKKLK